MTKSTKSRALGEKIKINFLWILIYKLFLHTVKLTSDENREC